MTLLSKKQIKHSTVTVAQSSLSLEINYLFYMLQEYILCLNISYYKTWSSALIFSHITWYEFCSYYKVQLFLEFLTTAPTTNYGIWLWRLNPYFLFSLSMQDKEMERNQLKFIFSTYTNKTSNTFKKHHVVALVPKEIQILVRKVKNR